MYVIVDSMLVNILWIALVTIRRTNLFTMRWSRAVNLTGAKMFRVDGEKVKPDTWYRLENGELMEVENED